MAKKHHTIPEMIEDFIAFSTVSLRCYINSFQNLCFQTDDDKKPEFKEHPVIVAQGYSKKEIWKYFIQIENALIELPEQTKFIEAVDILIRSYYVFNVDFPKNLSVFMNFIMMNVYDISIKSKYNAKRCKIEELHSRPRDFWRKIQKHINDMK